MNTKHIAKILTTLAVTASLGACGTLDRVANIGKAPAMNPVDQSIPQPKRTPSLALPMPQDLPNDNANSLWRTGARAFFKDPRAATVGDIVTVQIDIQDKAAVDNSTTRSRSGSEKSNLSAFLGLEDELSKVMPDGFSPEATSDFGSTSGSSGKGTVDRSETINMTVAAIVTQVLPNGNFLIQGRQEVRVNFEIRELLITGIIRPEDITNQNTIKHTQIAEARISYGGRGQLTDMQQARYGQQLYEILFPF